MSNTQANGESNNFPPDVLSKEEAQEVLNMGSQTCTIPKDMMLGTGEQLFDHIATCLGDFLESHNLKGQTLPLGFTFSFPCEQLEIDKSILIRWTKGFNCSGVEGKDVVQLLKEAIQRRGDYHIGSVAMVNDTVGTMMSCGYRDQSCEIGMIIGNHNFNKPDSGLENAMKILTELGLDWDPVDASVVRLVCDTISSRSAHLCAAALATLVNHIRNNRKLDHLKTTVGVDGTVYRKHPTFSSKLQRAMRLLAPQCDITFLISEDSSGKGAAMVTAVAQRLAHQSRLLEESDGEDNEEEQEKEEGQ